MKPKFITFLRRLYHYGIYAAGGATIIVSLVAIALKFWLLPDIQRFKTTFETAATRMVGQTVTIGSVAADWYGLNPRLTLGDVRMIPDSGAPLILPKVEAIGSWLSLPLLNLHLASLNIDRARLDMRRDSDGVIYVAGIPVNRGDKQSLLPDWLLRQPRIVVRDAQVRWNDEKLAAPELTINHIRLLLENRFGHHRFGGIAEPSDAARRVELRGDLKGRTVRDPKSWSGDIYARVDDTRLESWRRWVPWSQESVKTGVGTLRFWIGIDQGGIVSLVGDAKLGHVAINLQQGLPDMTFDSLSGRIGWSRNRDVNTFFVEKLRFKSPGGASPEPASVYVKLTPDGQGNIKRIDSRVSNLRLEALTALSSALPLPRKGHDLIAALNPRGLVETAQGHWAGHHDYSFEAQVRGVGARAYEHFPGFAGLSLEINGTQDKGEAVLAGRNLYLHWPSVFRDDLAFTQLDAKTDWRSREPAKGGGSLVHFEVTRIGNADLDGSADGTAEFPEKGTPFLDIRAHLDHGEARAVYRHIPVQAADSAYEWLKRSLIAGQARDVNMVLKGPLDQFPYDQGGGKFEVTVPVIDASLQYATEWPRITGIHGLLVFHGRGMTIVADSGRILDAHIGPVKGVIPDLLHADMLLLDGRASGDTSAFLDFIRQSPIKKHTGHFTDRLKVSGNGNLALSLRVPLDNADDTTVSGNYTMQGNRIEPGNDLPALEKVSGTLSFTEKTMQAKGIQVQVLGLPARLDLSNPAAGQVRAAMAGRVGAEALRPYLPASLSNRLKGSTDWHANIGINPGAPATLMIRSDLAGMGVDLPPPLAKPADQPIDLAISKQTGEKGLNDLSVRYGDLISARALWSDKAEPRINVRIDQGDAAIPQEPGLWVSGKLKFLDLDAWRNLSFAQGNGATDLLREASVNFNELRIFNRRLHDTHLQLRPAGKGWSLSLAGKEATGEITTTPVATGTRVFANFKRLSIPDTEYSTPAKIAPASAMASLSGLELNADVFNWKGRDLGDLRLGLSPAYGGFRLDYFSLSSKAGKISGKGLLSNQPRRPTVLDLTLESPGIGDMLSLYGFPGAIKGGATRIAGTLDWTGGLEDFEVGTLEGDLDISIKRGQFLKVDPGAAKLLGILSLQALPRRIALDFRDVFSEGFAFDEITGQTHLERGSVYTNDLHMNGPAAKITMSGVLDLSRETQNLRLSIQPRLGDTVAMAGALIGGPVVGLGTLVANKILKNPIGQVLTFDYMVSGSWSDPVVKKLPRPSSSEQSGHSK